MSAGLLVEDFFRHEYGRLVASLTRRFGPRHLEAIEDAAQHALLRAMESWRGTAPPDNPSAWLYRVAKNALLDHVRTGARREALLLELGESEQSLQEEPGDSARLSGEVEDDLLRMLFLCCNAELSREAQLTLALKTLCGFSVAEIAARLFASEASVYKRLTRARNFLAERGRVLEDLSDGEHESKLSAVRKILYLMFTEGHLSSSPEHALKDELCVEAMRLATLLALHPVGRGPESFALLALMHLHFARRAARTERGGLLLLEEQARSQWDRDSIAQGLRWLELSAQGEVFSRYHAEASIAAEHCLAPSYSETRWEKIAELYQLWESAEPSPMHRLNRALATAEWRGAAAGLEVLEEMELPSWLEGSYLASAVRADLHYRAGNEEIAAEFASRALRDAPSHEVRAVLRRRFSKH